MKIYKLKIKLISLRPFKSSKSISFNSLSYYERIEYPSTISIENFARVEHRTIFFDSIECKYKFYFVQIRSDLEIRVARSLERFPNSQPRSFVEARTGQAWIG